jgi:serine/threonine-protein phosphatase 2A regulatory subunit B'
LLPHTMLKKMHAKIMSAKGKSGGREDSITQPPSKSSSSTTRPAHVVAPQPFVSQPAVIQQSSIQGPGSNKHALPTPLGQAARKKYFGEPMPTLRDVPAAEKQPLFVRKLQLCSFTFDFTDQIKDIKEKEVLPCCMVVRPFAHEGCHTS